MNDRIQSLDYALPERRQSPYGVLALLLAVIFFATVAYVRLEAENMRYSRPTPFYWNIIDGYAWVPGVIGIAFAITGLIQNKRNRALSFVALAAISATFGWLAMPTLFR